MSIENIKKSLKSLIKIHENILNISQEKTEILKEGSAEQLQQLLIKEQKYVQALEHAEKKRSEFVKRWFEKHNYDDEEQTISTILNYVQNKADQTKIEQLATDLTHLMIEFKNQEQLNFELIQQSMQFIQTSLNMFKPSIESMNYDRQQPKHDQQRYEGQSIFDSKA